MIDQTALAALPLEDINAHIETLRGRKRDNAIVWGMMEMSAGKRWLERRREQLRARLEAYRRIVIGDRPPEVVLREFAANQVAEDLLREEIKTMEMAEKVATALDKELELCHNTRRLKEKAVQSSR